MCSPSQKRHKNGPMIYVCSRALQWISCSFLEAPGQCDQQARNDTKMDQWSAFIPAHFSWPRVVFCRRQYNVLTKSETTQKWTNDLRLFPRSSVDLMQFFGSARTMWSPSQKRYQNGPMICVWSHALHVPVHSSHLEFIAETNVCAYTKIICIWKFLTRICEIFKTVKPEEVSFVFSTKSTQSLRPILSCYLCFPPAFLHFYFLPLLGKCFSSHNPSKFWQIAMLDWAWWRLCLTEWREWWVTCQQPIDNISHLCCYGFPLEIFVTHTQGTTLSLTVAV